MLYLKSFLNFIPSKVRTRLHPQFTTPFNTLTTLKQKHSVGLPTSRKTSKVNFLPQTNAFTTNFLFSTALPSFISFLNELRVTLLNA